jgi:hypothetical protein
MQILRDPIWQTVGVVVSVLGIFLTLGSHAGDRREVSVIHNTQDKMANRWLPGDRFSILHDDKKFNIERTVVDYYLIKNESLAAIRPEKFVEPFSVAFTSSKGNIISVENCSEKYAQACTADSASTSNTYVGISWSRSNEKWTSDRPLLNSGDVSCVLIVSEHNSLPEADAAETPDWNARIEGYSLRTYASIGAYQSTLDSGYSKYFSIAVVLVNAAIFWFLTLFAIFFFSLMFFASQSNWVAVDTRSGIVRIVLLALFAISTAEILVDGLITHHGGFSQEHPIIWPLLLAFILLFAYLIARAFRFRSASRVEVK